MVRLILDVNCGAQFLRSRPISFGSGGYVNRPSSQMLVVDFPVGPEPTQKRVIVNLLLELRTISVLQAWYDRGIRLPTLFTRDR